MRSFPTHGQPARSQQRAESTLQRETERERAPPAMAAPAFIAAGPGFVRATTALAAAPSGVHRRKVSTDAQRPVRNLQSLQAR